MDFENIRQIADLGGTVILTVMLWLVWKRLTELTDKFIDILTELRLQGLIPRVPSPHDDHEI